MKTKFCLLISIILMGKILYAKEITTVKGQIITYIYTIDVKFLVYIDPSDHKIIKRTLQNRIHYIDNAGNRMKLKPNQADEVRFKYQNEEYRLISLPNDFGLISPFFSNPRIFLYLVKDGKLKLYDFYYLQNTNGMGESTAHRLYLQLDNNAVRYFPHFIFKIELKKYLNDCPRLIEEIEKDNVNMKELDEIVDFYNTNCGN